MKKISLIATLFIAVLLLQNCKKDTVTASTTSSTLFFAIINDTSWTPSTVQATVNFNPDTKVKTFGCSASTISQRVLFTIKQSAATNSSAFPIGTYAVDDAAKISMSYYNLQKNATGVPVLTQFGTVSPGSGTIIVTATDSVKKEITGTFSYTAVRNNYDNAGNIISVSVANIAAGAFNKMPYTFTAATD